MGLSHRGPRGMCGSTSPWRWPSTTSLAGSPLPWPRRLAGPVPLVSPCSCGCLCALCCCWRWPCTVASRTSGPSSTSWSCTYGKQPSPAGTASYSFDGRAGAGTTPPALRAAWRGKCVLSSSCPEKSECAISCHLWKPRRSSGTCWPGVVDLWGGQLLVPGGSGTPGANTNAVFNLK
ncbi:nutritionally-regulated adipose and cardiac enriched protein homolog isoform X1 [Rhinolophus sinicus]|uniref:nutritionally-regulated adipose and cardiac enriched protein homolog isoform X1 n=1 Tax=Rhinolophus sinicus TaxID=89399 RepID=UPI003D7A552B